MARRGRRGAPFRRRRRPKARGAAARGRWGAPLPSTGGPPGEAGAPAACTASLLPPGEGTASLTQERCTCPHHSPVHVFIGKITCQNKQCCVVFLIQQCFHAQKVKQCALQQKTPANPFLWYPCPSFPQSGVGTLPSSITPPERPQQSQPNLASPSSRSAAATAAAVMAHQALANGNGRVPAAQQLPPVHCTPLPSQQLQQRGKAAGPLPDDSSKLRKVSGRLFGEPSARSARPTAAVCVV